MNSRKESIRKNRDVGASRIYHLTPTTKIPPQKVVLTVSQNKEALIDLIFQDLLNHADEFHCHRLVVTGSHPVPVELHKGLAIDRKDLQTTQEEADTIILHQLAVEKPCSAIVVADDTDVFVLLCHFRHHEQISSQIWMVSPITGRSVIDITATVTQHSNIMEDLLSMHGLTGCDTVAPYFGIGKVKALGVLRSQIHSISTLGDVSVGLDEVIKQCSKFILGCYGIANSDSEADGRYEVWMRKIRNVTSAPKLQSLPPTSEALAQNVARAHIQVAVWKNSLDPNPPDLDPLAHGWYMNDGCLAPVMLPSNTALAPDALLKMVKCECKKDKPCHTRRCSCNNSGMSCTIFCYCNQHGQCWNYHNRINDEITENDSDEEF